MRKLTKLLVGTLIGCLGLLSTASAEKVYKCSGGGVDGMYYPQCKIMMKGLYDKFKKTKTPLVTAAYSSKGGNQNGRRVAQGITDFSIIQKDNYTLLNTTDNLFSRNVEVLAKLGQAAVLVAYNKNGKITSDSDMQNPNVKIAMTSESAGSVSTHNFMTKLEPGYKVKKGNIKYMEFDAGLRSLKNGTIDVMIFVQSVQKQNKKLRKILKDKELDFMDVKDWNLNNALGGQRIYDYCKVSVASGWVFDKKVKTICTEDLVIVNKNVPEKIKSKMFRFIEDKKKRILKANM